MPSTLALLGSAGGGFEMVFACFLAALAITGIVLVYALSYHVLSIRNELNQCRRDLLHLNGAIAALLKIAASQLEALTNIHGLLAPRRGKSDANGKQTAGVAPVQEGAKVQVAPLTRTPAPFAPARPSSPPPRNA